MKFSLRGTPRDIACIELVELATDYLDDVLPARERRAFEHHLTFCDGCDSYVEQMRTTMRLTGTVQIDGLPDDAVAQLMTAFRGYQAERTDEPSG